MISSNSHAHVVARVFLLVICFAGSTALHTPISENHFLAGDIEMDGSPASGTVAEPEATEASHGVMGANEGSEMPANGDESEATDMGKYVPYYLSPPLRFVPTPFPKPAPTPSPTPMPTVYKCAGGPCLPTPPCSGGKCPPAKKPKPMGSGMKTVEGEEPECDITKGEGDCVPSLIKKPPVPPPTPTSIRCANHTECGACTNDVMCGWCSSTCQCMDGTPAGPLDMPCERTTTRPWDYAVCTFDLCNDPCIPAPPPVTPHWPTSCARGTLMNNMYPQYTPPPEQEPHWGYETPTGHMEGMPMPTIPPLEKKVKPERLVNENLNANH